MTFRVFLERLGLLPPPPSLLAVIQEATTRSGEVDRRAFLRLVGAGALGAAVAPALDLEHLIWTPAAQVQVATLTEIDTFLVTPSWVMKEVARHLVNKPKGRRYRQSAIR